MIQRKDPANIIGFGTAEETAKFIESDFRIRSGLCPNGHGLMEATDYGQRCPQCGFFCNTPAEKVPLQ
jgi:hypothetical protein